MIPAYRDGRSPQDGRSIEGFAGRRVLVVGLGRFGGGVGVTRWLVAQGARVTVTDCADARSLADSAAALSGLDVVFHFGGHDPHELDGHDLIIVNPAVDKSQSKLFSEIIRRDIPWTTELNLFCERCRGYVIGVTGAYGKSTTCAMLAHVLKKCRRIRGAGVYLGGNIGGSLLCDLPDIKSDDVVVLEMSSAQLENLPRIQWAPDVAVFTNLSPHHMDRYGCYGDYLAAKFNLLTGTRLPERIIVGEIDLQAESALARIVGDQAARVVRVARPEPAIELCVPGQHNQANAAFVLTVCQQMGLRASDVLAALSEFGGLPHRLEFVRSIADVRYYNDSKSTSPAATIRAVESIDRPIVAIVGGQDKRVAIQACATVLAHRCREVICIGECGPSMAAAIRAVGEPRKIETAREAAGLVEAVRASYDAARPGEAVLFSPGAPSFDTHVNFVERGRCFVEAVNALV